MRRADYETMAAKVGLILCQDPSACRAGLSAYAHFQGRRDPHGYIHWGRRGQRVTERGLYAFCKLIAHARHYKEWQDRPAWWVLYAASTQATLIARNEFHVLIRLDATRADRMKVLEAARGIKLRTAYRVVYNWATRGLNPSA